MGQGRVGRAEKIPEGFWEEVSLWGQPRLSGEPRILCAAVTELCASPALVPTLGTEAKSLFSGRMSQGHLTSQFWVTSGALHLPSCDLRPPLRAVAPSGITCGPVEMEGSQ